MKTGISKKVTDGLLARDIIENDEYEICQYGLEQLFIGAINFATLIILGGLVGMIGQSILFVLSFMVLRRYSGGYHTTTPLKCYLLTVSVIITALLMMKYMRIEGYIYAVLLSISSVAVLHLSPVESKKKPLDKAEKTVYRNKTIMVWCIEIMCILLLQRVNLGDLSLSIIWAQIITGISLVCAHSNKRRGETNEV